VAGWSSTSCPGPWTRTGAARAGSCSPRPAVAAWGPLIILDLADPTFIDCCGLGILVGVLQWTRKCGGNMPLAAPQQRVRKVLSVTGLMDVFSVYPSVDQAAAGLGGHRSRLPRCKP
jgi:ABC-type transporter Mla MlaB component